jgi:hypothetical protein
MPETGGEGYLNSPHASVAYRRNLPKRQTPTDSWPGGRLRMSKAAQSLLGAAGVQNPQRCDASYFRIARYLLEGRFSLIRLAAT